MRVLVTGVAGFVGSRLARALLGRGDEVRGIDSFLAGTRDAIPDGVEFLEGDIRNEDDCRRACDGVAVVFHQAARRSVAKSIDDPILTDSCNTLGTLRMLTAARDAGVQRFVYASSSSIYGDPPEPLRRETQTPRPISPYGVSKLAGEHYCRVFTELHALPTVALRYFNVYGPGQPRESQYSLVFPAFVDALCRGEAPEVNWDGEQSRDFTYIDDVISANLAAAAAGTQAHGEAFNIARGQAHSINEVLESVSKAVGTWIEPVRTPRRAGDVRATLADIAKARELLGWEPQADWDASVAACVDWFRTRT